MLSGLGRSGFHFPGHQLTSLGGSHHVLQVALLALLPFPRVLPTVRVSPWLPGCLARSGSLGSSNSARTS